MIHAHVEAFITALEGAGLTVHDGLVPPSPAYPYAVVYFDSGLRSSEELSYLTDSGELNGRVMSVGKTPQQARWVADRVVSVAGTELTVSDRKVSIEHVSSDDIRRDEDNPSQVVFFGLNSFTLLVDLAA